MYDFLRGRPVAHTPGRLVLEVAGVGFELSVPLTARFALSSGAASELTVWTHLVVREDAHLLFAFPDRATRDAFRLLLSVQRVGPAIALALVSQLTLPELASAVAQGDARALKRVKGVGERIAQQVVLDLKDKAARLLPGSDASLPSAPAPSSAEERAIEDAASALVSIGYSEKDARKAAEAASKRVGTLEIDVLIREALRA